MDGEYLLLKWGTLKGVRALSDESKRALQRYDEGGDVSLSAMRQRDTPEQKEALCDLIDAIAGPITNDWSGEDLTKEAAKAYVREYRA